MKIALITESLDYHSGSRAPIEFAGELAKYNQVTLFAFSQSPTIPPDLSQKMSVVTARPSSCFLIKMWRACRFWQDIRRCEVVSFHGTLPSLIVAKLTGRPIITTYYGTQLDAYRERFAPDQSINLLHRFCNACGNILIKWTTKIYLQLSNRTVAISRAAQKELKVLYHYPAMAVYLGTAPFSGKTSPQVNHARPFILSVSRITPYKGFHRLIKAVQSLVREVDIVIAGSAPQPAYLQYLNRIKTPRTTILINPSDDRLEKLYQQCSLYASCDRYLFFGLPSLEAACYGKPSVLWDYQAAAEIVVHGKTGYIVHNQSELKHYLYQLISRPKLRKTMGNAAQKRARIFTWKQTAKQYQAIFDQQLKIHKTCQSKP